MDHNQERRRGHFHRGRRGPERRGPQPQERPGRDQVDVEQIMRDIRGRIAQRQGIDLSNQQIQDLAARRLESILDPRAIKPSLLDALRRNAGATAVRGVDKPSTEPAFTFEDTTIYDSHRGILRLMRRLLNPLLKLFFNPNPLIRALHLQATLNVEAAEREADRDRRQAEWNALHYEIVQRLVTEVSRVSLELQSLSMRVESLDAKVDFNERRVRGIEGTAQRPRPQGRPEPVAAAPAVEGDIAPSETTTVTPEGPPSEGARRRRRRRRGRRNGVGPGEAAPFVRSGLPPEVAPVSPLMAATEPSPRAETQAEPQPVGEHFAQQLDTPRAPVEPPPSVALERPMDAQDERPESARPLPPPLPASPAPDERAAPEPFTEPPDVDRSKY